MGVTRAGGLLHALLIVWVWLLTLGFYCQWIQCSLSLAVFKQHVDVARMLIAAGADVHAAIALVL
jgi:hypothetical protein